MLHIDCGIISLHVFITCFVLNILFLPVCQLINKWLLTITVSYVLQIVKSDAALKNKDAIVCNVYLHSLELSL